MLEIDKAAKLDHFLLRFKNVYQSCSLYALKIGENSGCGGAVASALDSGSSGPGSSPDRGHCVVFLGETLDSRSAPLHPGVPTNLMLGVTLPWTSIPSRGELKYS